MKYAMQMMWAALASLFSAVHQSASAINNVATVANVSSYRFLKEEVGDVDELKKLQEDLKGLDFLKPQ